MSAKRVFVTGGNAGIGLALCKQLIVDHGCFVYMGARSLERGTNAIKSLIKAVPEASGQIELVQIDTCSAESVKAAAQSLATQLDGNKLYALVNNAGTGINHDVSREDIIKTNVYGVKLVTEAIAPLIDASEGRIVNLGSGAGPGYVRKLSDKETQTFLSSREITLEELHAYLTKTMQTGRLDPMTCYRLSKAAVHKYTEIAAKTYPTLKINAVSPGFVNTNMTKGFGASLSPAQGTVSIRHCLFGELKGNAWYYGSDAKRSPLHLMRDPGDPEFAGY